MMEISISAGDPDMVIQQVLTMPAAAIQETLKEQKKKKAKKNVGSQ